MEKKRLFLTSILMFVFLFSCQEEVKKENSGISRNTKVDRKGCFYSYNEGTTKFNWEAYKTSQRIGVEGGFNEIKVKSKRYDNPILVLESISFEIKTSSIETNNLERNGKIIKHFFETINTPTIKGSIVSVNNDGTCKINVNMNDLSHDVIGEYSLKDNLFSFTSVVDVSSWNALSGIISLNNVCKDLHMGSDGISKLWPEVSISFVTKLKSDCN